MSRAVFLDRDGVINRKAPEGGYITSWEEMQFLPRVAEAIARINRAGLLAIVASNQRCVAKGLISEAGLQSLHERMRQELAAAGARIDHIYYCPHELKARCNCRKPAPGMLLAAAREHGIDLPHSWMVGDSDLDIDAGRNAGCKTALVKGREVGDNHGADLVSGSLFEAAEQILKMIEAECELSSRP